jgi:protein-L-isoaspartate(D-aspartate) O-methyltransferase
MTETGADPFQAARQGMVEAQLKHRGIRNPEVLRAFLRVPRHRFVPEDLVDRAYWDGPLPIGEGQTISQPYMVAIMTQLARVGPGDRVLEIGTGSGYQAAILLEMGAEVFTIERRPQLHVCAIRRLLDMGYVRLNARVGDGTLGWPEEAPFQIVIVTAGAPKPPQPLLDQLAEGGRMVVPVEEDYCQVLYLITRTAGGLQKERHERCTFVPLVGEHGWKHPPWR